MAAIALDYRSRLAAPPDEVWRSITSMKGIARETMPLFRMTAPRGVDTLGDMALVPGKPLFRSRILAFGFLPMDHIDLTLAELTPGEGFVERSPMGSMRLWQHTRRLEPAAWGTILSDELVFEPRVFPSLGRRVVDLIFRTRHRNLRRQFGEAP